MRDPLDSPFAPVGDPHHLPTEEDPQHLQSPHFPFVNTDVWQIICSSLCRIKCYSFPTNSSAFFMWQVQETPVGHGKYRESLEPHRPPLSLEVNTWTGHRTAQPQHRPVPGAAQGGRADSKQTQCQHGLFSPLSWLTTVGQAALLLKALPGFMHYILPVGNGNVSPGKWKSSFSLLVVQWEGNAFTSSHVIWATASLHILQWYKKKKPFSTMIWPQSIKEFM